MSFHIQRSAGILAALSIVAACSATSEDPPSTTPTPTSSYGGGGTAGGGVTGGGGEGGVVFTTVDGNVDADGDGITPAQGDCNDTDPNINIGAVDVPPVPDANGDLPPAVDSDCDGQFNPPAPCDAALVLDSGDPMDAARAAELCQKATTADLRWGVLEAKWVLADGSPPPINPNKLAAFHLGHGNLPGFGPNVSPRAGGRLLGVSSGSARQPTDPDYYAPGIASLEKDYGCASPEGFPKESPSCPGVITDEPRDATAVELTIRVPTNATGFSFDFNFFTSEWPVYVCQSYNDFFVAMLSPIPAGQPDGNISFDSLGNPVSVNNALVEVCGCETGPPCIAGEGLPRSLKSYDCAAGTDQLVGTGFETHAATGWLVTKAPVTGGETITLRWAVYDSADAIFDTTTLIDNWQWVATPGVAVGTDPVPK